VTTNYTALPEPLPALVEALHGFGGCIGVRTCTSSDGMIAVFAWFESKQAAERWYFSKTHWSTINTYFPDLKPGIPLKHVPSDVGPILVIASFTPINGQGSNSSIEWKQDGASRTLDASKPFPFKQASIELYAPIFGGVSFGGHFGPNDLKVRKPHKYRGRITVESIS